MFDGKTPPRALSSFGVSGLLNADCKIYYDNLFNSKCLGRVSDLICSRLRDLGLDELRVRALVLFAFYEAFRNQTNASEKQSLAEPLVLECGVDSEKVAIGMVFRTKMAFDSEGLSDRIVSVKPSGFFEELLVQLHQQSDQIVVRIYPDIQIEVVMLLSIDPSAVAIKSAPEIVVMHDHAQIAETPPAADYIQLSDMDYAALLSMDPPGQKPGIPRGVFLAQGATELEQALSHRAHATAIEEKFKISRKAEVASTEVTRVKGSGGDLLDTTAVTVTGTDHPALDTTVQVVSDGGSASEKVTSLLKKVWPFKKTQDASATETQQATAATPAAPQPQASEGTHSTASESVSHLIVDVEGGGLDRTLNKAQKELEEVKKEVTSPNAKRWMEGFVGDLMQEKVRVAEAGKKLNSSFRQKEHEFRTKELQLQEELKRRDEALRQRTNALNRAKEQLGLMTMTVEKLKSAQGEKTEEGHYKQKLNVAQKLLSSAKEDNQKLNARIEELKSQITAAQNAAKAAAAPTAQNELVALKMKYDRMLKQSDELRKMNEQLTDRIQQLAAERSEKPNTPTSATERQLEAAMRQLTAAQKESDQYKLRAEESEREQTRLKAELKRAQDAAKIAAAKAAAKPAGGRGTGTPPKAA